MAKLSRRKFIAGGAALAAAPLMARDSKGRVLQTDPRTVTVEVKYDESGIVPLCPIWIQPGDAVVWTCKAPTFSIHFPGATPLMTVRSLMPPRPVKIGENNSIQVKFPSSSENPHYGQFKYFIAVLHPEKKVILTEDPDIIIDPKPKPVG